MADLQKLESALRNAHKAGDADAARKLANALKAKSASSSHPEFDGSQIPGYDPTTGLVEREPASDPITSGLTGIVEGLPVIGAPLQEGAEMASAGIGSMLTGVPYEQVRREIGQDVDASHEQYPGTRLAGNVTGAIGGTVPLVMAAPGAFGVTGGGLLSRSLASGATSTGLGAADAAVRSGGDVDAVKRGAMWGGAFGAAAPGLGRLAGKGVNAITSRFRGAPSGAARVFNRAVSADAIDDFPAKLAQMGDDALPMDLGPNLQRQAGALAATPGRGQEIVRGAIAQRQAGSGTRVTGALDDALGGPVDTVALADDIIVRRAAASKPLYDAAYSKPVPFSRKLEQLLKRPAMKRALSKAQRLAADEGVSSKQWFANVADDGKVTIRNVPDVRQLDLTKRALDDMISAAQRAGNNNEARILIQQKNLLTGMIDDAVPEYRQARMAFSGPSGVINALEDGQKAFANNLTPKHLNNELLKMGASEREAYIQGARAKIAQIMGTARNDALAARAMFQKGFNREKLEILVGKEQAVSLLKSLDAETAFTRTRDVVTGNSETAARAAAMSEIGGKPDGVGIVRSLLNMRGGDAAASLGDGFSGSMRGAAQSRQNEQLARLLTERDPRAVNQVIRMVRAAQKRGDITAQRSSEIVQSLTVGSGIQMAR